MSRRTTDYIQRGAFRYRMLDGVLSVSTCDPYFGWTHWQAADRIPVGDVVAVAALLNAYNKRIAA